MTALTFSKDSTPPKPLHLVSQEGLDDWLAAQPAEVQAWVTAAGFKANAGSVLLLPEAQGIAGAVGGLGSAKDRARKRFVVADLRGALPEGVWRFVCDLDGDDLAEAALGWLLAAIGLIALPRHLPRGRCWWHLRVWMRRVWSGSRRARLWRAI